MAATLLAACQGGTPWGATPQQIPLPKVPRLEEIPAHVEAGTTAGAQRIAERVRAALAAEPGLAGAQLGAEGFEGGVIVLSGTLPSADARALAVRTARGIAGVRDVVDRTSAP
ncbi:BON domain-containing protein [Ottowia sp.]|uniref:BON domain-containing protein n=1 Tax=Ottowia sp. TaxID=1898956 RepID=UPI0039E5C9F5